MAYGAIINLPSSIVIDGTVAPFAFVDVLTLTSTTTNGSKTYTGFTGRTIRWYQNYNSPFFSNQPVPTTFPIGHTLSQTFDVSNNPVLNWSTTIPSGGRLVTTVIYVIII